MASMYVIVRPTATTLPGLVPTDTNIVMVDSIISQPKVSLSSWNTPVSDPSKTNGITTGKNLSSFFTYQPGVVGVKSLIHFEDTLTGYDDYADPELYPKDETGRSWYQSGGDTNYVTTANAKFGTSAMLSNTPFWMHAAGSGDFDFGSGDFCISSQVYLSSGIPGGDGYTIYQFALSPEKSRNEGHKAVVTRGLGNHLKWYVKYAGSWTIIDAVIPGDDFDNPDYHHFAFVRHGNVFTIFYDGQILAQVTLAIAMDYSSGYKMFIGYNAYDAE